MSLKGPVLCLAAALFLGVLGCTSPIKTTSPSVASVGQLMIGQTRLRLLSCAGRPNQEIRQGDALVLRYYREAPMFEESMVASKGSKAGLHHGCWATVSVEDEQITGMEYRSVPDWVGHYEHCEEIFLPCVQ